MRKFVLTLLVLSAFLFPAALSAGEEGAIPLEQLQAESDDPESNVIAVPSEGGEILYLDKKAYNATPSKQVVLGREEVLMMH